ncbi:MAG: zf-HC2 domain-containing protein [Myxococcales bacterium]|nr:zf-HC2 domain-containing protein [Myxococcales bacterium]
MSCEIEQDLTAFLDGELPELRAKQVEAHLPGCPSCAGTLSLIRRTVLQLAALPELSPSLALRRKVMARLDEPSGLTERLRALFRPAVLMPALGMAAAASVAVVLSVGPESRLDPEQMYVAMNMEMLEDFEVVGLEPEDVEVVTHLHELEALP